MPQGARQSRNRKPTGGHTARRTGKAPSENEAVRESGEFRLNRFIARAGVCSRRKADEAIAAGKVRVNGEVVTDFSTRVTDADTVEVSGRVISARVCDTFC